MMDRRQLLALAAAGLGTLPARAQQRLAVPTVGFIGLAKRDASFFEAFEFGLREQGLEPGRTVRIEERNGDGSRDGMRQAIAGLLASGVRVFVTAGDNVAHMVQEQSGDAAIVVASLESLDRAGIAGTLSRPDGNVTGFATFGSELIGKRMELLREILPGLQRLVVVINPTNLNHANRLAASRTAGVTQRIDIIVAEIASPADLEPQLRRARDAGGQAFMFPRDFLFESLRPEIVAATAAVGLPAMYDEGNFVHLGGLISYNPSRPDLFRRSAAYVVKLLAGARPADLPIQQPTKFELVINLKTAKGLGLTIPQSILIRADEVIE